MQPTALVHEAYIRLVDQRAPLSRGHFMAVAATQMRRVLSIAANTAPRACGDGVKSVARRHHGHFATAARLA